MSVASQSIAFLFAFSLCVSRMQQVESSIQQLQKSLHSIRKGSGKLISHHYPVLAKLLLVFVPAVSFKSALPRAWPAHGKSSPLVDVSLPLYFVPGASRSSGLMLRLQTTAGRANALTVQDLKAKLKSGENVPCDNKMNRAPRKKTVLICMPPSTPPISVHKEKELTKLLIDYKQDGDWESALATLWWAAEHNTSLLRPIHANMVLSALANAKTPEWESACALLDQMPSMGLRRNAYSYASAMVACSRAGQTGKVLTIFRQCSAETDSDAVPNNVVFSVILQACSRGGSEYHHQLLAVFTAMAAHGVQPDAWQYSTALNAYAQTQQWQRAVQLLIEMESRTSGPRPESHCYAATMRACLRAGELTLVLGFYERMLATGVNHTAHTLVPALDACAELARAERAGSSGLLNVDDVVKRIKSIVDAAAPTGVLNENCYAAAARAYAEAGAHLHALRLVRSMQHATPRIKPSVYIFTAVISSLELARQWELALEILHSMNRYGVPADAIAVEATLKVLGRAGRWRQACALIRTMGQRLNVTPSPIHLTTVLKTLSYYQEWDVAYSLLEDVFDELVDDFVADSEFLEIVTFVCSQADAWQQALHFLNSVGDAATVPMRQAVVDALERAGEWQHAQELQKEMNNDMLAEMRHSSRIRAGLT